MDAIVASNVFYSTDGNPVYSQGARVIESNLTDYEIV